MKLLNDYFKLQQEIFDYFGYIEDWHCYPIDNCTDYYWTLLRKEEIRFAGHKEELAGDDNYYSSEIISDRFLPKSIYVGEEYTMILVDTHTDRNRFLAIFDNNKKVSFEDIE